MAILSPQTEQNLTFIIPEINDSVKNYCNKNITSKIVLTKLKKALTNEKYIHSLGVAQKAKQLAKTHGLNPQKALLAGLLHDYAKYMSNSDLLEYAKTNNLRITAEEQNSPDKLHAPVGADKVKKEFGITDKEILRAIETHGIGSEDPINKPLKDLEKLIIIADKIEPYREKSSKKKTVKTAYKETGNLCVATAALFAYKIKNALKKGELIDIICIENYNNLINKAKVKKELIIKAV